MKRTALALILTLLFSAAVGAHYNVGYATESPADVEEVILFLKDVLQLDTTKYETTLIVSGTEYWPELGGIAQTTGQYSLDSTGQGGTSLLTVSFTFWDEELIGCSFYEESQGPPLYSTQPETDPIDAASGFLQRYQTYTGDIKLAQMRSLLDTVDAVSNTTKTFDTLSLEINVEDDRTYFAWSNTVNETEFNGTGYSGLHLVFQDGDFSNFKDDRKFYELGSSEVNISLEDAVEIAVKRVENYSYMFNGEDISDFNVSKEFYISRPHFMNRTGDPMELYPCWIIELGLDKYYPGNVASIQVLLWADSGEAFHCQAMSYGISYPDPKPTPSSPPIPTSTATPTPSPEPVQFAEPFPTSLVIAFITSVAIIGLGLLVYFKKRKH
jgi:hypothetical protein